MQKNVPNNILCSADLIRFRVAIHDNNGGSSINHLANSASVIPSDP